MSLRYLLSVLLLAASTQLRAQECGSGAFRDAAAAFISRNYSYVSPGWQRACDSFLAICPEWDELWQMKAMPAIKGGDWAHCFSNLSHAVEINPQRWLPYQAFLKCLFTKDYGEALRDFNRCDSMAPGAGVQDHSFDFYRGLCCLGTGDSAGAFSFLSRDVRLQEKYRGKANVHFFSRYYLGHCLYQRREYAAALAEFGEALRFFPQFPEASFYSGMCLNAQGQSMKAKPFFAAALRFKQQGFHSNEDQEYYVNYPYAVSVAEIAEALGP